MPGDPLLDTEGRMLEGVGSPQGLGGSVMQLPPMQPTHTVAETVMRDPNQGPPEWLHKYMDAQPPTDPYHNPLPTPEQKSQAVIQNKFFQHMTEREQMKLLKDMKDRGAL